MQQSWYNACPTVPFSFTGGEFSRSPKEMKECLIRDWESTTMHKTTAHYAPSVRQNDFVKERAKKEELIAMSPPSQRFSPRRGDATGTLTSTLSYMPQLKIFGTDVDLTMSLESVRRSPRHSNNLEELRASGRKDYLKSKRLEPYVADMDVAVFTPSSRRIGEQYFAGPSPFTPRSQADFRRKGCHETLCTGVLPRIE